MSIRGIPNQVYSAEHQLLDAALTCHKVTNFDGKVGVFLFLSDLETRQMRYLPKHTNKEIKRRLNKGTYIYLCDGKISDSKFGTLEYLLKSLG